MRYTYASFVAKTQIILRICIIVFRCFLVPFYCLSPVFQHAITPVIAFAKSILCLCIILFCSFLVPLYRFRFLFIYAIAEVIAAAKLILCISVSIFRRFLIPLCCFLRVPIYAHSIIVTLSQLILCFFIILFRRFSVPFGGLLFIFFYAFSLEAAITKCTLRLCISLLCRFAIPPYGFFLIFIHTPAVIVAISPFVLPFHVSLFRSSPIPHCSFLHFLIGIIQTAINEQFVRQGQHCRFISIFCGFLIPLLSFIFINCHATSIVVALAQFFLCLRIALHCRLTVQFCGFCLVLADTVAGLIAHTQLILCFRAFLFCRFCVPLYSRLIVREFRIQPPGHILRCYISLSCRRFVPSAGLFVVLFNAPSLIIALAQCALCLGIALLCGLFVPHDRIFFAFFHTRAVLIAPCHLKLCLRASVISGRDHVLLERHFHIACLLIILGIMQVVLLGFLLRFLLRFLPQTKALHEAHEFSLFIFRPIEQEAVYSVFLSTETHSLDLSPQTIPIHTASRRFKPFFNRFCLDGIRDFHLLPTHTDRLQFICKTYFHLNFAHDDSLPMYL